jgi:hypothetical protein
MACLASLLYVLSGPSNENRNSCKLFCNLCKINGLEKLLTLIFLIKEMKLDLELMLK